MKQAWWFLLAHLCGGLLTLTQINSFSIALSFAAVPIAALYPLFKRFTYYPQVVLGNTHFKLIHLLTDSLTDKQLIRSM